jgi:hypothetical protein
MARQSNTTSKTEDQYTVLYILISSFCVEYKNYTETLQRMNITPGHCQAFLARKESQ